MAQRLSTEMPVRWGKPCKYPWDDWLDGSVWSLTPGADFTCSVNVMRTQVAAAARQRQMTIHTSMRDGALLVQARAR